MAFSWTSFVQEGKASVGCIICVIKGKKEFLTGIENRVSMFLLRSLLLRTVLGLGIVVGEQITGKLLCCAEPCMALQHLWQWTCRLCLAFELPPPT